MLPTLPPTGRGEKRARRPEGELRVENGQRSCQLARRLKDIQVYSLKLVVRERGQGVLVGGGQVFRPLMPTGS